MLTIVHLSGEALADPRAMATLADYAAEYELVLVCAQCTAGEGLLAALRRALPRHRLVAMLVDGEIVAHERRLIIELLDEGTVPLVLTSDDPTTAEMTNWAWLAADTTVVLPA